VTDAKLICRNSTAVTMIFGQSAAWTVFLLPFLEQVDGNSCGPIACLKLMEIYHVITADEIMASDKSYREIVFNHQAKMITNLNSELLVTKDKIVFNHQAKMITNLNSELLVTK
jgi:hypothetical protein